MPVLSLHNPSAYSSLPTGSASYSLGLSGAHGGGIGSASYAAAAASNAALNSILSGAGASGGVGGYSRILGTVGGLSGLGATHPLSSTLGGGGLGSGILGGVGAYGGLGSGSYSTYTNPLLKLKTTYDDLDLLTRPYGAGIRTGTTPSSPIPSGAWGLDAYGLDGVNPAFMHAHHSRHGLEIDSEYIVYGTNVVGNCATLEGCAMNRYNKF